MNNIESEKLRLLSKILNLQRYGIKLTKYYSIKDDIMELKCHYEIYKKMIEEREQKRELLIIIYTYKYCGIDMKKTHTIDDSLEELTNYCNIYTDELINNKKLSEIVGGLVESALDNTYISQLKMMAKFLPKLETFHDSIKKVDDTDFNIDNDDDPETIYI